MAEESKRAPFSLPNYGLGDEGKPNHFVASTTREAAAIEANSLDVGDAAFIKRSDLKWTYAIVSERVDGDSTILRFEVDSDRNRKSFPEAQWGKYIRVITVEEGSEEAAPVESKVEVAEAEGTETAADVETKPEEAATLEEATTGEATATGGGSVRSGGSGNKEDPPALEQLADEAAAETVTSSSASVGGGSIKSSKSNSSGLKSGGSWFSGMFGSGSSKHSKKTEKTEENKGPAPVIVETTEELEKESKPEEVAEPGVEDKANVEEEGLSTATPPAHVAGTTTVVTPQVVTENIVQTPDEAPAATPAAAALAAAKKAAMDMPEAAEARDDEPSDSHGGDIKLTQPPTFLPSPKSFGSTQDSIKDSASKDSGRSPLKSTFSLKKKNSLSLMNIFNKDKSSSAPKAEERRVAPTPKMDQADTFELADATSPKMSGYGKEWFDPEASEVDYDKNPTDLFQALEARQFSYADEMFRQVNYQFTRECKTWVVARGKKSKDTSQLRFRALPLHAALVFGAPDDMVKKILNAYPKAARGRDVKGRLPIHLAMEHNASEEIMTMILEAFPKGFFAKDKKDMTPLEYVNANMDRAFMKRYVPLLSEAKLEDERAQWEVEKQQALESQKKALKHDPVYMQDIIESITEDVERTYAAKMELLETSYKKEIQLLKKKHDGETQALLEGFEVKLNFERKLQKLKGK